MTNQEAIETLQANYPDACFELLREAVDTAISALQAQDVPDNDVGDIKPCEVCYYLEDGDTLYKFSDWDGGIGFDYIRDISYCPKCGRRL